MPKANPIAHDYMNGRWGHDLVWRPDPGGLTGSATGWGLGIEVGHVILMKGPHGGASPYRVKSIEYERDPADMWNAKLEYERGLNEVDLFEE